MASEEWKDCLPDPNSCYLQKFRLYETRSKFYMIGRDKNRTCWRVLKIERLEPSELNILEDSKTYSEFECFDLLRRLHEGNRSTGGLKFVTACYGIVGFIKFLGPYYMLLITKRKQIGVICGHAIYAVSKSVMIPVPHSSVQCSMAYSNNEKRYKKLLSTVDLTKDFFFSYSYHIMHSLQKNLCNNGTGQSHYETMFVWNEFLTRGIRNSLKNTSWTVALVYGFFKQVQLSVSGKKVKFTLIARRSRHYAGTRYLKRGVNEKGRVANDVETEQIVIEDVPDGCPVQISSVVQNRGSIPLFWSQETSRLNIKPDIILSKKDQKYEATKLHFENLVKRYGNPIIILNLIKTREKKPRETVLGPEFANAVQLINRSLPREYRLRFLHWDLQKYSKNRATNALTHLCKVTGSALNITGIFYCQLTPNLRPEGLENLNCFDQSGDDCTLQNQSPRNEAGENVEIEVSDGSHKESASPCIKTPLLQKGVLRTNCIDCLDRTNVAQYCYGLVALGRQLYIVGILGSPNIDLYNPLAEELMKMYEIMGDTLAFQYGGSAAHNKIFCETRGQWKATTHSQEFIRSFQRYYSNAYADAEKQDAINVFLGYFQPQLGKVALWELGSDQHYNVERHDPNFVDDNTRSSFKRSLSDGNFPCESDDSSLASSKVGLSQPEKAQECNRGLSESTPEITSCGTDISYSRYTPSMSSSKLFTNTEEDHYFERDHICYEEHGEACNCSNFLDMDWVSSSGNSCEEDMFDRSVGSDSAYSIKGREQTGTKLHGDDVLLEYNESFVNWVMNEVMLSR